MNLKAPRCRVFALLFLLAVPGLAVAQGTAFTYQGQLNNGGAPANGTFDLSFGLYTNFLGSNATAIVTNANVAVSNGVFTTSIDFTNAFDAGTPYWLEIGVGTNLTNAFFILAPRQPIQSVPYAITAKNVTGDILSSQVTGTIPLAQIQGAILTNNQSGVNLSGSFSGDGSGLVNLNAANLVSGKVADALLTTNVALLNHNQTFSGVVQFPNPANSFAGNGNGLTNIVGIASNTISVQMLQPAVAGRLGPPIFGNGSDGNVTISNVATLTRDMYYSNLTVTAAGTLKTAGFRVFVYSTCTITGPGSIQNNGGVANGSALGPGAPFGSLGGGSGGALGTTGAAGAGTNVFNGGGGAGGTGGAGPSLPGGLGGTVTPVPATNGGLGILRTFPNAFFGRDLANSQILGGSGGGGGAGVNGITIAGGGGGGAGVVVVAAPLITGTGTIQAKGGAGGAGNSGASGSSGGGAGPGNHGANGANGNLFLLF